MQGRSCKQYIFRSYNIYCQRYAFWWKCFHMPVRKRRQKGLKVSNFVLLLVVFKWHHGSEGVKFIQFKRAVTPICIASTSVSAISQTPWNTAWRSWHDVPVLFQNPAWQAQTDTAVSLWVSRAKYQFRLQSSSWPFCSDSAEWHSRHMVMWFGRHGDAFGTTENAFFACIYNPQITVSPTSLFSVSFNGNHVKNHP